MGIRVSKGGREIDYSRGKGQGQLINLVGISDMGDFNSDQAREVFTQVRDAWVALARSKLRPKDAEKYIAGIAAQPSPAGPGKVIWELKGFDALALEFGWAPPPGKNKYMSDGIGEFDGAVHDMRSYMLNANNPNVRKTVGAKQKDGSREGAGKLYFLVPFHENAASSQELSDKAAQGTGSKAADAAHVDLFRKSLKALPVSHPGERAKTLSGAATAGLPVQNRRVKMLKNGVLPARKGGAAVPFQLGDSAFLRARASHKHSKYHHIIRNKPDELAAGEVVRRRAGSSTPKSAPSSHKYRFTMIRTINEDLSDRSWFTAGYPAANLIKEMRPVIRNAFLEVFEAWAGGRGVSASGMASGGSVGVGDGGSSTDGGSSELADLIAEQTSDAAMPARSKRTKGWQEYEEG